MKEPDWCMYSGTQPIHRCSLFYNTSTILIIYIYIYFMSREMLTWCFLLPRGPYCVWKPTYRWFSASGHERSHRLPEIQRLRTFCWWVTQTNKLTKSKANVFNGTKAKSVTLCYPWKLKYRCAKVRYEIHSINKSHTACSCLPTPTVGYLTHYLWFDSLFACTVNFLFVHWQVIWRADRQWPTFTAALRLL